MFPADRAVALSFLNLGTFLGAGLLFVLMVAMHGSPASADESQDAVPEANVQGESEIHDPMLVDSTPAPISSKVRRYAQRLIDKYDRRGDGKLQEDEWQQMGGNPRLADLNEDGVITEDELAQYIANYSRGRSLRPVTLPPQHEQTLPPLLRPSTGTSVAGQENRQQSVAQEPLATDEPADRAGEPENGQQETVADDVRQVPGSKFYVPAARLPSELPEWFRQRDANGDGQITFAEFAAHATPDELDDFERYDLNGDGVITVQEYLRAVQMRGQGDDEDG